MVFRSTSINSLTLHILIIADGDDHIFSKGFVMMLKMRKAATTESF